MVHAAHRTVAPKSFIKLGKATATAVPSMDDMSNPKPAAAKMR